MRLLYAVIYKRKNLSFYLLYYIPIATNQSVLSAIFFLRAFMYTEYKSTFSNLTTFTTDCSLLILQVR